MAAMVFRWESHGSLGYLKTVELRKRILRHPLGLDFSSEELAAEAAHSHLACYEDDALVGCLVMVPAGGSSVKMRQVAVDTSRQGGGIGKGLILESERWAREQGFKRIVLNARESAVPFYLRLGYEVSGCKFEEVGLPHFGMAKSL